MVREMMEARDERRLLHFQKHMAGYRLPMIGNLSFDDWAETLGSERLTVALLDRVTHHVSILEMKSDRYRLAQSLVQRQAETLRKIATQV